MGCRCGNFPEVKTQTNKCHEQTTMIVNEHMSIKQGRKIGKLHKDIFNVHNLILDTWFKIKACKVFSNISDKERRGKREESNISLFKSEICILNNGDNIS